MAMSTFYLHRDFSKDAHHSKVFKLATWDPCSYAGDPWAALEFPGTTKEAAGPRALARACPWAQAPAASFAVPGDPEAAHGSPAYGYGTQVANLNTLLQYHGFDRSDYSRKQN